MSSPEEYPLISMYIMRGFSGPLSDELRGEYTAFLKAGEGEYRRRSVQCQAIHKLYKLQEVFVSNGYIPPNSSLLHSSQAYLSSRSPVDYLELLLLYLNHPKLRWELLTKYKLLNMGKYRKATAQFLKKLEGKVNEVLEESRLRQTLKKDKVGNLFKMISLMHQLACLDVSIDGKFLEKIMHSTLPITFVVMFVLNVSFVRSLREKLLAIRITPKLYKFFAVRAEEIMKNNFVVKMATVVLQILDMPSDSALQTTLAYCEPPNNHQVPEMRTHPIRRLFFSELISHVAREIRGKLVVPKNITVPVGPGKSKTFTTLWRGRKFDGDSTSSKIHDLCSTNLAYNQKMELVIGHCFPAVLDIPVLAGTVPSPRWPTDMDWRVLLKRNPMCEVSEKLDGLRVMLYVVDFTISLQGCGGDIGEEFYSVLNEYFVNNFKNKFLHNNYTYIFEAVFSDTEKCVRYNSDRFGMYLVGLYDRRGKDVSYPVLFLEGSRLGAKVLPRRVMPLGEVVAEVKRIEADPKLRQFREGFVIRPLGQHRRYKVIVPTFRRRRKLLLRASPWGIWRSMMLGVSDVFLAKVKKVVSVRFYEHAVNILEHLKRKVKETVFDLVEGEQKFRTRPWVKLLRIYANRFGGDMKGQVKRRRVAEAIKYQILMYLEPKKNILTGYKFPAHLENVFKDPGVWGTETCNSHVDQPFPEYILLRICDYCDTLSLVNFSLTSFFNYLTLRLVHLTRYKRRIEKLKIDLDIERSTFHITVERREEEYGPLNQEAFQRWKRSHDSLRERTMRAHRHVFQEPPPRPGEIGVWNSYPVPPQSESPPKKQKPIEIARGKDPVQQKPVLHSDIYYYRENAAAKYSTENNVKEEERMGRKKESENEKMRRRRDLKMVQDQGVMSAPKRLNRINRRVFVRESFEDPDPVGSASTEPSMPMLSQLSGARFSHGEYQVSQVLVRERRRVSEIERKVVPTKMKKRKKKFTRMLLSVDDMIPFEELGKEVPERFKGGIQ